MGPPEVSEGRIRRTGPGGSPSRDRMVKECAPVVRYDAKMKWGQLEFRSLRLNDTTRFRLARPSDHDFLTEMGRLSGGVRSRLPITEPGYAAGIKASLSRPGGYVRTVIEAHNKSVDSSTDLHPIVAAVKAGSFDVIAVQGKNRVGAMSVGASQVLLGSLMGKIDDHQLLSLVTTFPKLISLAVIPEVKGDGIGGDLMAVLGQLLSRMGCAGIYGECDDVPSLVRFYEQHQFTVLAARQPLNTWPVGGRHVVQSSALIRQMSHESQGPFIMADEGQRVMFRLSGNETETLRQLATLNEVPTEEAKVDGNVKIQRPRASWFGRVADYLRGLFS